MILKNMLLNKYDMILLIFFVFLSLFLIFLQMSSKKTANVANVYYEDKIILTIDLNTALKTYSVDGANGKVIIEAGEGKIRVKKESSPLHLCSKQGYIKNNYEQIICLPNKIIIELEDQELDTVAS